MPLFKGLADEYKIDFDLKLANYFKGLIIRCGEVIYDLDCLDANMPPLFHTYEDQLYVQRQMQNHYALNLVLQERIKETEIDCLGLH